MAVELLNLLAGVSAAVLDEEGMAAEMESSMRRKICLIQLEQEREA